MKTMPEGKSIVVFNGAVRENGNTDAILKSFGAGAEAVSVNVRQFDLRELKIGNCLGCRRCRREMTCERDDDMTKIRPLLEQSDVMVFASPIYWCEITGLMKTFIDRFYFYHHWETAGRIAGRKAAIVSTLGEAQNIDYEMEVVKEFYRRAFKSLKIELLDHWIFPDLMDADSVLSKPDYLKFIYGKGLEIGAIAGPLP
jgi:multimeric flavodoxin WrbA